MNSPTVIVPNKPKFKSDPSQLDIPVSPYETSRNVDVDNPVEHSREPRIPHINRNPARKSVEVRAKKYDPKGIHGRYRQVRYPELYKLSRYSLELVAEMKREYGEPTQCRVWIEEILAAGVPSNQRGKFVVTRHPGFPAYWALFELIQRSDYGPHFRLVSIAQTPATDAKDYLSPALQTADRRWDHMRGVMGDPREFTRRDFEIMREQADSMTADISQLVGQWQPSTEEQFRKLRWLAVSKKAEERQAAAYREKQRVEDDYVEDMHDYMFDWLVQAANYGKRHKVFMSQPGEDPRYFRVPHPSGYVERIRKGTKRASEVLLSLIGIAGYEKENQLFSGPPAINWNLEKVPTPEKVKG